MDTIYPEPVSQIYRRMDRRKNGRLASRYRTLPVTFSEIKEVDEENIEDRDDDSQYESSSALTDNCADVSRVTSLETAAASAGIVSSKSDHDLKTRFGDHPTLGGGGGETQLRRRQRPTMKSVNRKLRLGDAAADPPLSGDPSSNGDQRSSPTRSSLTPRMSI